MKRHPALTPLLATLLLALAAPPLSGQSAADILDDAREAYERRMAGIENYTVVQRVMGQETTLYFVRDEVEGFAVFRPQTQQNQRSGPAADPTFFYRPDVADRMTYEGSAEVEGHTCHVLRLEDFEGLDLGGPFSEQEVRFDPESMEFCIDEDEHVLRRMEMKGSMTTPQGSNPMEMTGVMSDYREVDGMLHPFHLEMTTSGMGGMAQQNPEMAEAMAEMRKQLEQLPEAQRKQMEEMMRSRMEAMQGAMEAAETGTIVIETVEVKVNSGPPEGGGGEG